MTIPANLNALKNTDTAVDIKIIKLLSLFD